jgi:hypothetical protein
MIARSLVFTNGCRIKQQATLVLMGFLLLVFLLFLLFQFSPAMLLLVVIAGGILVPLNIAFSRIYQIQVDGNKIAIENMWKRVGYSAEDVLQVRMVRFVCPYPFNPYIKFIFKDGNSYIGVIPNRLKYYLASGGIDRFLREICALLKVH